MAKNIKISAIVLLIIIATVAIGSLYYYLHRTKQVDKNSQTLFLDKLDGSDRLVTNEYVYWNPNSTCPYKSDKWDMTSGTLLIKNGVGYSGLPNKESRSVCESNNQTNSYTFRLNTKDASFTNTVTSLDYEMLKHGDASSNTENSYDGLHIWVRYQSQYALYAVSISRWDGNLAIKKKVPVEIAHCSDPSNEGCYYDLVSQVNRPDLTKSAVWHHADITTEDRSDGKLQIKLVIDGQTALEATDGGEHDSVYHTGAVGVRGDNTEFYFKNFLVKKT